MPDCCFIYTAFGVFVSDVGRGGCKAASSLLPGEMEDAIIPTLFLLLSMSSTISTLSLQILVDIFRYCGFPISSEITLKSRATHVTLRLSLFTDMKASSDERHKFVLINRSFTVCLTLLCQNMSRLCCFTQRSS